VRNIEFIEDYQNLRSFPLTLIISSTVNIKTVIKLMQIVKEKNSVKYKLLMEFTNVHSVNQDIRNVMPCINNEDHPILHRYISLLMEN
jgi:hypothetical protein